MIVADLTSASSRLRALQYVELLERDGVQVRVCATKPSKYLPRRTNHRGKVARLLYLVLGSLVIVVTRLYQIAVVVPSVTAVLLQKDLLFRSRIRVLERTLFGVCRLRGVRVVLDIDDPIYLGTSLRALPFMDRKMASLAAGASVVLAGSEPIARRLRQHSREVQVVPTRVRPAPGARTYERREETLRLVWSGTATNARHLQLLADPLQRLRRLMPVSLEIVTRLADLPGGLPDATLVEWSEADEAEALARADVALAPLADDAWTRAKCGGRVLTYFSTGAPTVASPVGAQAAMVRHGITGLTAVTVRDWSESILALARSEDLRTRLGRAGRALVEDEFAADRHYPSWRDHVLGPAR